MNYLRSSMMLFALHERICPPAYTTTSGRSYTVAPTQRGSRRIWFDLKTVWFAKPSEEWGRPEQFANALCKLRQNGTVHWPETYSYLDSDLPPVVIRKACGFVQASATPDRRKLEIPGPFIMTGW